MDFKAKLSRDNPWVKSNWISKIFCLWVLPLMGKGFRSNLTIHDIYDVPEEYRSAHCSQALTRAWDKCVEESGDGQKKCSKPELWKMLLGIHKWKLLFCLILYTLHELGFKIAQCLVYRLLLQEVVIVPVLSDDHSYKIMYASIFCLCSFLFIGQHLADLFMLQIGLSCRVACSALVFRKSLRLAGQASVGHVINLLSNDVARFDNNFLTLFYCFLGPIQAGILLWFLFNEMGVSIVSGGVIVLLLLASQVANGKLSGKYRSSVAERTDHRSKIMNEILMGMKIIKMHGWEGPFSAIVNNIRRLEMKELRRRAYLRGTFIALYLLASRFITFFIILTYVLSGHEITADKAFFTAAVILPIGDSLGYYFSNAVATLAELNVSLKRIQKFLNLEEQSQVLDGDQEESFSQVSILNACAAWKSNSKSPEELLTLKDLNLDIRGGQLVTVVGAVGSGKSSLLHLLISELPLVKGVSRVKGRISYASQEPWIFSGSIRQNILFGEPFDTTRYDKVASVCALSEDFKRFPQGDLTPLGERGITLSGGQKARVSLARALYRKADIYLIDDPLSALDASVGHHIFQNVLQTFLQGKLRILVTHALQYLNQADLVVVLTNGEILAKGTYKELCQAGTDFSSFSAKDDTKGQNSAVKVDLKEGSEQEGTEGSDLNVVDDPPESLLQDKFTTGSKSIRTFWKYFNLTKRPFILTLVFLCFLLSQVVISLGDFWLSIWMNAEEKEMHKTKTCPNKSSGGIPLNDSVGWGKYHGMETYVGVYSALVTSGFLFYVLTAISFFTFSLLTNDQLHNRMFCSVVRAPMQFFDENPTGQILNRFTKDMGTVDELLPITLFDTLQYCFQILGIVVIICVSNLFLIIPTVCIALVFWILRTVYVRTSTDLRRLEALFKSPVFVHISASIQGLTTVRAFRKEPLLVEQFDERQDVHSSTWFMYISVTKCFAVWAQLFSSVFMTVVTFTLVIFADTASGTFGLVITLLLGVMNEIQWVIRQSAEAENHLISVQRVLEYCKIIPEAPLETDESKKPPKDWPSEGSIRFESVSLNYRTDKPVLNKLTFEVKSKEKIGIVGRTGSGKSSVVTSLFRLTEPTGEIIIDGVKTSDIGLHELRKHISIIPQDPVLFSGTVRYNLDTFQQFTDDQLWQVLKKVELESTIMDLEAEVSQGGSNFSVGQRQLLCLARAILRRNKIFILDEATANVDPRTDELIQKTIKTELRDCTVLTIAHRLHSVVECDKILVLDDGVIKEYDHPHVLFQNPEGHLTRLAGQAGDTSGKTLKNIAANHFRQN